MQSRCLNDRANRRGRQGMETGFGESMRVFFICVANRKQRGQGGMIAVWTDSSGRRFHPVSPSADTDGKVHCRFRLWRVFTGQVAGNRTEAHSTGTDTGLLEQDISTVPARQRQS